MASSSRNQCVHESVASGNETNSEAQAQEIGLETLSSTLAPPKSTKSTKGKKWKVIKPRSDVWSNFIKVVDENGEVKAQCIHCERFLAAGSKSSGTSSLWAHSNSCAKRRKSDSGQSELLLNADGAIANWKYDEAGIRKAMAEMIVIDELPFKFVEKEGFTKLFSIACPRFRMPSRWTIARDIFRQFEEDKLALKQFLKMNQQRICITTDTWTSVQNLSYMSLTAHYVDRDWILHKKILKFCPITSHKGDDIGRSVEACLSEWGIDKIFTVTVDNASANDVAIEFLKKKFKSLGTGVADCKYIHMRCIAHILNLIVVDGLKHQEADSAIKKIRFAVRYVKKSPQRFAKFKACIVRAKIESKALLRLDVSTRWNSTYLMLASAVKFERAFDLFAIDDENFGSEMLDNTDGFLESDDWNVARKMILFLEKFYELTKKVSGSTYVTSNFFFNEIVQVADWLEEWSRNNEKLFQSMVTKMKEKYEKYWGDLQRMNMLIYVACILDPRRKLKYVEFVIRDMHQSDLERGNQLCNQVKCALNEMFKWYEDNAKHAHSSGGNEASSSLHISTSSSLAALTSSNPQSEVVDSMSEREKKFYSMIEGDESLSDLERYLKEEPKKGEFDVLKWWKLNKERFPVLSELARDVLAVPVSTVASESAFSTGGRVLDDFRSSLTPSVVESLICSQNWLRKKISSTDLEEDEEAVQEFEIEMAKHSMGTTVLGPIDDSS